MLNFYRNTSTIRYANLSLSAEEQEENEDDISNLITEEGNVLTNPGGGCNREPRQHKISIMSTDSEYTNTTDMTMQTTIPYQPKMHFDDDDDGNYEERDPNFEAERKQFCTKDLISWAYQIARGMSHLANRKIVHGDLAARNVLLAHNNLIKICDFGLARNMQQNQIYQKTSDGPLPIKWMAVESLTHRIFSSQSDVWSYGIVLWELFSLARTPYPGVQPDESFTRKLESGHRMSKPPFSTDDLYKVMKDCWSAEPGLRPTFLELADKMGEELKDGEKDHYLELNKPFEAENEEKQQKYVTLMANQSLAPQPMPPDLSKRRSPNIMCTFQKSPKIKFTWSKMKQKTRRSSATLNDILGHMKMKELVKQDLEHDQHLLSPTGPAGLMSESTPMLHISSQNDLSQLDLISTVNSFKAPTHVNHHVLKHQQRFSASYGQLPSFYNPCYDNLAERGIAVDHPREDCTHNKGEKPIYGINNNVKISRVRKVKLLLEIF